METFLPESVKTILAGILAGAFVLVWLARRFPAVAWLQPFQLPAFQMSEAQKARRRRWGNRRAAFEIMLAGIAVPLLYVLSRVFMFREPTATGVLLSCALGAAAIALGTVILIRNK